MRRSSIFFPTLLTALAGVGAPLRATGAAGAAGSEGKPDVKDYGVIMQTTASMIMDLHYLPVEVDDKLSSAALEIMLERLDPQRMYFTEPDAEFLRRQYGTNMDDAVFVRDVRPFRRIWNDYVERVRRRLATTREWLTSEARPAPTPLGAACLDRRKVARCEDEAALDLVWNDELVAQIVEEEHRRTLLAEPAGSTVHQAVLARQEEMAGGLRMQDDEKAVDVFLSALAAACDPHSDYMTADEQREFHADLQNRLCGIGIRMNVKDGLVCVLAVMPDGPAARSGGMKSGDVLEAVRSDEGNWKLVTGLGLDEVGTMIRGAAGTRVALRLKRRGAEKPIEVTMTRAEVDMVDGLASASLVSMVGEGTPDAADAGVYGVVKFKAFYGPAGKGSGKAHTVSADVRKLLNRLEAAGAQGVVLDLRGNAGGLLDEAVKVTGLFAGEGVVVQQRERDGKILPWVSRSAAVWTRPVVVLTDHQSASASEICAAALQDCGRAVVAGDETTYGKGTVQQPEYVSDYLPWREVPVQAGMLKVTTSKFYRITGESTQHEGVRPDVVIPSVRGWMEEGERFLDLALPSDRIGKASKWPVTASALSWPLEELRSRSAARQAGEREFSWLHEDHARLKALRKQNRLTLDLVTRQEEASVMKRLENERWAQRTSVAARFSKVQLITVMGDAKGVEIPRPQAALDDLEGHYPDAGVTECLYMLGDMKKPSQTKVEAKLAEVGHALPWKPLKD